MTRETKLIGVDAIEVGKRHRDARPADVERLAQSMAEIGLRTPISVQYFPERPSEDGTVDSYVLVTGAHRLAAAKSLGWTEIECLQVEGDEIDAELWEISENLHRADLTVLERSEQVARWIELTEKKIAEEKAGAVISAQGGLKLGRGRPESGVNEASRKLGVKRTGVQRSKKMASLMPEAKAAAKTLKLDDNGKALLEASKGKTAEEQVAALQTIADNKAKSLGPKPEMNAEVELFAEWLRAHAEPNELPMIITWITNTKPSEVATALRRQKAA